MNLFIFNPWWRDGHVSSALAGKGRRMLAEIMRYAEHRQIVVLSGVRRSGKTTLLFQVIDRLLGAGEVDPHHVLYYSFDEAVDDIQDILAEYEKTALRARLADAERVYVFFDEIQKLAGWPEKVKIVYDLHPNVKIFLSGSAAIDMTKGTRESLAGRFFDLRVEPLDFDEYLAFTESAIDKDREDLFELELRRSLEDYLLTGGFIEALAFDEMQRKKYFREGLLERVVFRDLPGTFQIRAPDLLYRLVRIVAERPGMYLDYRNLANDLDHDHRTIADYFTYLEQALLMAKLYNYSPNRLTSEKKLKRVYLSSTAFTAALAASAERSMLLEQYFVLRLRERFFWRTPQRDEVDLVHLGDDDATPVEIKMRGSIQTRDAAPLFKFMARYGSRHGYIISDSAETTFTRGVGTVHVVPYWKYWTLETRLGLGQRG